jgi:hypothetical protein
MGKYDSKIDVIRVATKILLMTRFELVPMDMTYNHMCLPISPHEFDYY